MAKTDFLNGVLVGVVGYWFFSKTFVGKRVGAGLKSMTEYYIGKAFEKYETD